LILAETLSEHSNNAGFNYNIAGIGKDVASDLYQNSLKA